MIFHLILSRFSFPVRNINPRDFEETFHMDREKKFGIYDKSARRAD